MKKKTLGIAAPASAFDRAAFDLGLKILHDFGFKILLDDRIFAKEGYLAGDDAERAAVLAELFANETVDGVMCARGGYGSMRLLPLLDFAAMANRAKPLIGFSDCTALFGALYEAGGNCWHGPVVTQLGRLGKASLKAFLSALKGEPLTYELPGGVCLQKGAARAPLFGGNLSVLSHLAGTPYFPNLAGHILFLEDQNEALYKIDRMLTQLKLMGVLNTVTGVVLGEFINCGDTRAIYARLLELLDDENMPVLGNFPAGHGNENLPLFLGQPCLLDSAAQTLVFEKGGY